MQKWSFHWNSHLRYMNRWGSQQLAKRNGRSCLVLKQRCYLLYLTALLLRLTDKLGTVMGSGNFSLGHFRSHSSAAGAKCFPQKAWARLAKFWFLVSTRFGNRILDTKAWANHENIFNKYIFTLFTPGHHYIVFKGRKMWWFHHVFGWKEREENMRKYIMPSFHLMVEFKLIHYLKA